jgi:sulfatase maturation enzyme AslB (radical SAM superfamily)
MKLVRPNQLIGLSTQATSYQRLDTVRISEPRIELIYRRLQALQMVVQLESDGAPVEIDGFRLKDPAIWTSPQPGVFSELWHISNACNMRCPFCYEEGDPQGASVLGEPAGMITIEELETRLRYRDARRGIGLFRPLTYVNEIFCHPRALEIIERLRAADPDEVLTLVTNGTYLTEQVVRRLAKLKPLFFNFSVNSLDPVIRRRVLKDNNPAIAIRAVELLREYSIPYLGSLVCWPTIPWSDVENTVRRLDAAGCAVIRYSLSAYSKHLKGSKYIREEFWGEGMKLVMTLMKEVSTPIKIEPYHYYDPSFLPNVAGVIKGSPAGRAGLRAGDRLLSVDGSTVHSANHALSVLAAAYKRGRRVILKYVTTNASETTETVLDDSAGPFGYPYDELKIFPGFAWGVLLTDNLRFRYMKEMMVSIKRHAARRVLICSSVIMKPIIQQMIAITDAFHGVEVSVEVPENRYFGGTIVLGDLLVVDDYVAFINEYKKKCPIVDLVLIPSSPFSLGEWRRDLTGTPFTEIERRTGIATELVHCHPLNG